MQPKWFNHYVCSFKMIWFVLCHIILLRIALSYIDEFK